MTNPLFDTLFARHLNNPAPFLILPDESIVSYDDFLKTTARFANVIATCGVKPGDRVAVQVKKSPQALAVYAACVQSGAVFLPLNTAYTPAELEYFVADAEASLLLCDEVSRAELSAIADKANCKLETLNGDGTGSFPALANTQAETFTTAKRGADDLAAILYTSGTTGRSKGAMLSQNNLLSNAQSLVEYWQFTSDDVLLHALPIFHTHGLFVATNVMLLSGGAMIFLPGLNMDQMFAFLPRATTMMGVPTFYTRLLDDARLTKDVVSHMRLFVSGSAPLLAETHTQFEARTGKRILERYGMTETNMNTSNPYEGERRAGTVGFPLPRVEVRICEAETGAEVPTGEAGVLEVRGPNVFSGYWRMPEKTAEEFRPDGFFITGDIATKSEDGYISIVGRAKDLIISGGYNIYPKEIELVLDEIDGVNESAVVGVPHPDFGEGVLAVIVPQPGATLNEADIIAATNGQLARFKQPKRVVFMENLPRNTMGKVQKNVLRDDLKNSFTG